ncbi:MAG: 3-deoxy-manno-octulosonate cytidylyltransferase [Bacteroidota bacterium]
MNIIGVIPARYASTRFPGKPLIDIAGKSMIQRVYEQCKKTGVLSDVIVATDDERIAAHVKAFGGQVIMTDPGHQSGTDRCAEVISKYSGLCDAVINIQGDEPFIDPLQIELVAKAFGNASTQIASLVKRLKTEEEIKNPNVVKAIFNAKNEAIYFSRSAIPYRRNPEAHITYYKHVGIYGYRKEVLDLVTKLPLGVLEKAESLEQLRWIENGYTIHLQETTMEAIAIDTPDDLKKVLESMAL